MKCQMCGSEFAPTGNSQRYCTECARERKKAAHKRYKAKIKQTPFAELGLRTCAICGKEFKPQRRSQIYCSGECREKAIVDRNKTRWQQKKAKNHNTAQPKKTETYKPKRPMTPALERFFIKFALLLRGERDVFPDTFT